MMRTQRGSFAVKDQLLPRRCALRQRPGVSRQQRRLVSPTAAALTAADLRARALKLDDFDQSVVVQACAKLAAALGPDTAAKCDAATLEWFLRDRKLDVDKAAAKVT